MANVTLKEVSTIKDTSNNTIKEIWNRDMSRLLYCKPIIVSNLGSISTLDNVDNVDVQIQADEYSNNYVVHRSKSNIHEFIYFKYNSNNSTWTVKTVVSNNSSLGMCCSWCMNFEDEILLAFYWGQTAGTYADSLNLSAMTFPHSAHFIADMSLSNPSFVSVSTDAASDSATRNTILAFVNPDACALVTITVGSSGGSYYAYCNRYAYSSNGWQFDINNPPFEIPMNSTYFNTKTSGFFRAILVTLGLGDPGASLTTDFIPLTFEGWYDFDKDFKLYVYYNNLYRYVYNNYGIWVTTTNSIITGKPFAHVNTNCYNSYYSYDFGNASICSFVNAFSFASNKFKSIVNVTNTCPSVRPLRNWIDEDTDKKTIGSNGASFCTRRNFDSSNNYINTSVVIMYNSNWEYDSIAINNNFEPLQILQNFDGSFFYINYNGDLLYASNY